MTQYQVGDILALGDGYYRVYDDGQRLRLWFVRNYIPGEVIMSNAPKRLVHVQHLDGTTETDRDWLARQAEMGDYQQTVHEASYRQGV